MSEQRSEQGSDWSSSTSGNGEYADVNGVRLYYELHGEGRPLVLLHGGLGSGEMFGPVLPVFAAGHQVILPDLQAHGRTADVDRPLTLEAMADDIAALITHLGHDEADVVGYSLGGGVAFHLALRHPDKVRRLVTCSAHVRTDAIYAEMRAQQGQVTGAAAEMMKGTPMYELYQRVAPRPEDFPRLLDKIGALMAVPFDLTDEVRGLQVPTLVMCGDADMAPPSHYVEVFGLLDGGLRDGGWTGEGRPKGGHALAVIPGATHYDVFLSPLFAASAVDFLDRD
ncbi:alpha/beta fold hydrolase [Nocardioides iriomotensis]|uniref:Alpha/beta hydrolase n=1 Tax=Nocardioides iriomotensis TaxID=715784 RepID=A0A4Q5IZ05_9ACTN|nr:alpha/beta hydrolase [Nocardioides iriomotensis]RYU10311.1 alpha/beta hydrolase [Nocardioides iriomotensis]